MSNTVFENSAVRATVDIDSDIDGDYVAVVELRTPPNNFFSLELIGGVADATLMSCSEFGDVMIENM